jgi:integrase/recombinase XerC
MDRLLRARVMVAEAQALGLSLNDLVTAAASAPATREDVPTVSEYLRRIEPTFSKGTQRTYRSYWRLAEKHFGDRRIDTITVDDCEHVVLAAAERAKKKRPGSDARSPRENTVAALRALFERARRAKYVLESPAADLNKPRRLTSRRRGLDERELAEAVDAVRMTSRDIELDLLLVEFHLKSGARQEGALNLVLDGIDDRRSTVWLREKYGKEREQPILPSLVPKLRLHARRRGATRGTDKVFRTRRGVPTSRRHYDTLFLHVQDALPWSVRTPVTAHVLRHTAASAIERISGSIAVAEKFLGHEPNSVTATYTEARLEEVAAAVAVMTGEPHPLAEWNGRSHHVA